MHGIIDHGGDQNYYTSNELANYYAPNTLQMDDGRRILFGWIPGFKREQGWQGAISLPRDLSIDQSGQLVQKPVPELEKLRGKKTNISNVALGKGSSRIEMNKPQFQLILNLANKGARDIGFRFSDEFGKPFEIKINLKNFILGEEEVALDPIIKGGIREVQLFFDRTIIEIFVNGGLACATKVVYPDKKNLNFEIFSTDSKAVIENLDVWEMKSIW
jgi:beta-fructofuranosidase